MNNLSFQKNLYKIILNCMKTKCYAGSNLFKYKTLSSKLLGFLAHGLLPSDSFFCLSRVFCASMCPFTCKHAKNLGELRSDLLAKHTLHLDFPFPELYATWCKFIKHFLDLVGYNNFVKFFNKSK